MSVSRSVDGRSRPLPRLGPHGAALAMVLVTLAVVAARVHVAPAAEVAGVAEVAETARLAEPGVLPGIAGTSAELLDRLDTALDHARYAEGDSLCDALSGALARSGAPFERLELELRRLRLARARDDSTVSSRAARLLEVVRSVCPAGDARAIPALVELARVETRAGRHAAARALLEDATARLPAAAAAEGPLRADILHERGVLALEMRDPSGAEPHFEAALRLRVAAGGDGCAAAARSRLYRGITRLQRGRPNEAADDYARAVQDLRAVLGGDHPDVLRALNFQASFFQVRGDRDGARAAYEEILQRKRARGEGEDAATAMTLHNLAVLEQGAGAFARAETLYAEAYRIRRIRLGETAYTARSLAGCAAMRLLRGDYIGARRDLEGADAIYRARNLADQEDAALCRLQLGQAHYWTGEIREARASFAAALAVLEVRGRGQDRVTCLEGLARCLDTTGPAAEAEAAWRRTVAVAHTAFGADSPITGRALVGLGRALSTLGRPASADSCFAAGLRAIERSPKPRGFRLGLALYDVGHDRLLREDPIGARTALRRSLDLLAGSLEESHPHRIRCWTDLAWAALAEGEPARALALAVRAQRLERRHFERNLPLMTERHALRYRTALESPALVGVAALAAQSVPAPADVRSAWTAVVNSRELILDRVVARTRALGTRGATRDPVFQRFADAGTRLANLYRRAGESGSPSDVKLVEQAVAERDAAERAWAAATAARNALPEPEIAAQTLLRALRQDEALVGFVRFPGNAGTAQTLRYGAFVGRNGEAPLFVPLGDALVIDRLIAAWRERMEHASADLRFDPARAETRYRAVADSLRRLVWDPLGPALGDAATVLMVPDGRLSLVAFTALPTDPSRYLAETGPALRILSAEKDVVALPRSTGGGLLALGHPDFGAAAIPGVAMTTLARADRRRGAGRECPDAPGVTFEPLPATQGEAEYVARTWAGQNAKSPPELLLASGASERNLRRQAPGKRHLHVASHAVVSDPDCPTPGAAALPLEAGVAANLEAGIVLAGANRPGGSADDDGFLTAEEIRALNLSGVECVVLSACNTGAGTPVGIEGVLGLRRAFQIAGARDLVVSLWPVSDSWSRVWMEEFYSRLWLSRQSTSSAALGAGGAVLASRRRGGESTHPYYWAGFVAVEGGPIGTRRPRSAP